MAFEFYKLCHLVGLCLLFLAWGGLLLLPEKPQAGSPLPTRRSLMMAHGFALALMLIAGFGMLARLGIHWPWPAWVWGKALIWLALGGGVAMAKRRPESAKALWLVVALAGSAAAYLALYKPW